MVVKDGLLIREMINEQRVTVKVKERRVLGINGKDRISRREDLR